MRWREALQPVGMERVALLAPSDGLRDLLVNVADEGTVALGEVPAENGTAATGPADRPLRRLHTEATGAPRWRPLCRTSTAASRRGVST